MVNFYIPGSHGCGSLIKEFSGTDDFTFAPDTAAVVRGRVQAQNRDLRIFFDIGDSARGSNIGK
jgi:hypothetical protein